MTDLVNVSALWISKTQQGETYMSGYLGDAKLILLKNKSKQAGDDKAPDYRLFIAKGKRQTEYESSKSQPAASSSVADSDVPF